MATFEGRVAFEATGAQRWLHFTTNALCALEDQLGANALEIAAEIDTGVSFRTLRAMFWAGVGDAKMTLAQAGDLIDQVGKTEAARVAREAFKASFDAADDAGATDEARPPEAAAGTVP